MTEFSMETAARSESPEVSGKGLGDGTEGVLADRCEDSWSGAGKTSLWNLAKSSPLSSPEPPSEYSYELAQSQSAVSSSPVGEVGTWPDQSPPESSRILSIHGNYLLRDSLFHGTNNYGILSRWQSFPLCLLYLRDIFPYSSFRGSRRDFHGHGHYSVYKKAAPPLKKVHKLNILYNSPSSSFIHRHCLGLITTPEGFERPRPGPSSLFVCAGRPLIVRGPVPRNPSNCDCWLLAPVFTTTVWRRLWERQFSMHLRSRNLPRPSASSPLDNRAPPMANASQVPDLEGLHHEIHGMAEQMRVMNENNARLIQLLAAANPQPQLRHPSLMSSDLATLIVRGDRSHNVSTERARDRHRAPSPSLRERSSSSESSQTRSRVRRGRSPHRGGHTRARDRSISQKIRDLDARLDAINTGTNAPITVDALVRQTDPPFTERVLRTRISSKFKLPTQLDIYEGKTDPMDHLDSYKSLMSLQGCSDEVMCKAFSATLKRPARSWVSKAITRNCRLFWRA
ncbi:MATE efflux family protein [Actinidia rufa]|uniref:MATE efflux family protein n=1 Tax=Actinidia rufa TaxID=165716 RepID=A0A7J0EP33_9ERIC|nr:MATE efflux family protein [Actinidia rufa]